MVDSRDRNGIVGCGICVSAGVAIARFFKTSDLNARDRPSSRSHD